MNGLFDPFTIGKVRFRNRILRSSIGGRTGNYDGTLTDVWKNFEKRFADGGVGGIISTTFHVNQDRLSPPQYPSIAGPKFVPYLAKYIAEIKRDYDCKYIVQIGDPGYATYSSLFAEQADSKSSSCGFDLAYGYHNRRSSMLKPEIEKAIRDYADAAARVRESGADGVEITITKGYLIHQFLNPAINRRNDAWGGDAERRFHFLQRILEAVRPRIGPDFPLGIRLSGADLMRKPLPIALFRIPWGAGNGIEEMLGYAKRIQALGADYLHVVAGYGFPNPRDVPGKFPFDEVKLWFNSVRHLSLKAGFRAGLFNVLSPLLRWPAGLGWKHEEGINLGLARRFKLHPDLHLPVIANGGFQTRSCMERAIGSGDCDMISLARSLLANPDLPNRLEADPRMERPQNPCSFCNKCVGRTGTSPLGCYDEKRFPSRRAMFDQIMEWNRPDPVQPAYASTMPSNNSSLSTMTGKVSTERTR